MTNTRTRIYGLIALAVLALGLWWWLGRDGADETTTPDASAEAKAPGDAEAGGTGPAPKPLRGSDVDPWKAARAAVSGTVRDERAQPIAGAQVCASLRDETVADLERQPPHCVTTRADGSYRIDELLAAKHHVFASARGYLPSRYEAPRGIQAQPSPRVDLHGGATRPGVDFVLKEGGVEVTGVVKDIAGGEIEGAWVSSIGGWSGAQGATFVRSDAEGRFSLWLEPPEVAISALAEGYAIATRRAAVPGTVVEIFLTPESVVLGKVVWAGSGKPVADAHVWAETGFFGPSNGPVQSGADGSFRLEGLDPGAYKLSVRGETFAGLSAKKIHVGLGQTSEPVVVEVHPAFAVRGTVLVDGETPCSYGWVQLQRADTKNEPRRSGGGKDDGSVLVEGVLPGTYEAVVGCDGYLAEATYPPVVVTDAPIEDLVWSVHVGRAIRGKVLDAKGAPVQGAVVSASGKAAADPRARRSNQWSEPTTTDGSFVVDSLVPDTYEVSVYHDHLPGSVKPTMVEVPAEADATDVVLAFPATGQVLGIVRDEQGKPVSDATVMLRGPRWGGEALTTDEGRFLVPAVEVGEYRITARRSWSETMRAPGASDDDEAGQRIQVTADTPTEVELLVESQGGRITGRVVAEGGEPVADAFIEATRESDSAAASAGQSRLSARWGNWDRQPVLTDEDGRFVLENLAEQGHYTVYAHRKGGGEATAEHVAAGSDVELAIEDTAVLAGTVALAGGGSPRRFEVIAADATTGVSESDVFEGSGGRWRLESLPPGKYTITVDAAEGNTKTEVELAEGAEITNIALELTPRVTIVGRLVDGASGEPVPGLKVSASSEGSTMLMFDDEDGTKADQPDISDAAGRFVVKDAPSGKVTLMVMAPSVMNENEYGWTWISRRVPAEPREQDVGDIELVKERVGPGKEKGDLGFKLKEAEPTIEPEAWRGIVAVVRPGGPAAAAGLAVGDEILTIDGKPVSGTDSYRYVKLTRVLPGTKVEVGLAGDRSITITAGPPV